MTKRVIVITCGTALLIAAAVMVALRERRQTVPLPDVPVAQTHAEVRVKAVEGKDEASTPFDAAEVSSAVAVVCGEDSATADRYEARNDALGKKGQTLLYNGNKNVSEVVAENGDIAAHYEYTPFGTVIAQRGASAAANPWRFSSEYEDDLLALVYYNYRHYDSRYGRWLTRDILEEYDSVNIYLFLVNNAVENIDQLGMFKGADCCICAAALIGKFGGAFAGCAYGCYESQSGHYPFNKCLSDCVDKMLSLEEIYQQFKDNPAEWIGASACIICGVKAIKNICKPCSTAEKDAMQASVDLLCKQSGKLSCNRGQTLQELIASRNKMIACQAARVAINTKCFHGGDRGHRKAVNNLTKGIAKCTLLIKANGGR